MRSLFDKIDSRLSGWWWGMTESRRRGIAMTVAFVLGLVLGGVTCQP